MAAQLCMSSLLLCGMAGLHSRRHLTHLGLVLLALWGLSWSGAPFLALLMGLSALIWLLLDRESTQRRLHFGVLLLTLGLLHAINLQLGLYQNTLRGLPPTHFHWVSLVRLWVWFTWPAWPLVLWTLWVWRRSWLSWKPSRHIALPLMLMGPAAAAAVLSWNEERPLLLTLPHLAALAAFALPTLRRSVSALIDWFTLLFFSGCALLSTRRSATSLMHCGKAATPQQVATLNGQRDTLFKGETLRSMLLNAYGWYTVGTFTLYAGAGALLLYWTINAVKLVLNARGNLYVAMNKPELAVPDFDRALEANPRDDVVLYRGAGCERCKGSGYRGRTAVNELLVMTDTVRALVVRVSDGAEPLAADQDHPARGFGEEAGRDAGVDQADRRACGEDQAGLGIAG